MQPVINFELLRKAYAVISQVDETVLELEDWACNTIACAAGHLGCNDEFRALGFRLEPIYEDSTTLTVRYRDPSAEAVDFAYTSWYAVEQLFQCGSEEAKSIFGGRDVIAEEWEYNKIPEEVEIWITSDIEPYSALSDKQLWQSRVREFFITHNEPFNF